MTSSRPSFADRIEQWGRGRPTRALMALAALCGVGAATGQAPADLWGLTIISLAAMLAVFRMASGVKQAAWLGWAAGTGYFLLSLNWLVEPFLVDVARHGWMAPFAVFFMSAGLALFWGLGFAAARALGGGAVAWVATLAGAELLRAYLFTGFPWALIGHVLIDSPFFPLAAWVGAHGLTLLTLSMGALLWSLLGRWRWFVWPAMGVIVLGGFWGAQRLQSALPNTGSVVRLVQPNAPQREKWDPSKAYVFFERQLDFTAEPGADGRPDLIVWPETAVPWVYPNAKEALSAVAMAAQGVPLVLGIQRYEDRRYYNSAMRIDAGGRVGALYDKHHLVPFGEYMPFGEILAKFGVHGLAAADGAGFAAGPGARLMDVPGVGDVLPLICYEAVFPQDVRAAPTRPRALLQITNDAWFGNFSGPYQHLAQARLRAMEQGLPMIRVANTGVSAMIDPLGRVTTSLPLKQAGWVDAPLPQALPATLFAKTGDSLMAAVIAVLLTLSGLGLAINGRLNKD